MGDWNETEKTNPDVVPDELVDLAQETTEDASNYTNKMDITRKRKRQRARSIAVRTLFVRGLPLDATPREIYLLFMRFKGFQGSILKQATRDGMEANPVAFVMFRKREQAEISRSEIHGVRFDPNSSETIRADFAKANTRTTKKRRVHHEWDTNGNNETTQQYNQYDIPHHQPAITVPPPDGTPPAYFGTSEEMWCHQQMSAHNSTQPHVLQMPPQLPPSPNFAMLPVPHPPPLILTAPFVPPPINLNHMATPNCGQAQEIPENQKKCTLFIANMGMDTSEEELKAVFTKLPSFKRLKMLRNRDRTPVAFVEYDDSLSAWQAKSLFNGKTLFTSRESGGIRIEFAKKPMIEGNWKLNHG